MTEEEYKKGNSKIKRLAKKKDSLTPAQLEAANKLVLELNKYDKEHPKDAWKNKK